ncbi:aminoglycoside phosphotransferase [Kitasatospora sp. NPDC101155]|uniref:aminoglycoside phosphotransferase n=1 Tax=Kitasatospora sp. NPDC101155 TaxID=3364097 RepID=UPI0037FC5AD0
MNPAAAHHAVLQAALDDAAGHFGVAPAGEPVLGWQGRTIGARVRTAAAEERWLRVVWARPQWARGPWWRGNEDAGLIAGVVRPEVLGVHEWDGQGLRLRAELMTFVPGRPCSGSHELRADPGLPDAWWQTLRASLDTVSAQPTERRSTDQETVTRRLRVFFGDRIDPTVTDWRAAHGDLHWNNLHGPDFALLDWEGWGLAPAGYDAAGLYCQSLLVPEVARRVWDTFADVLGTPDGVIAQLFMVTRLLSRADGGEFAELVIPLHRHVDRLIGR